VLSSGAVITLFLDQDLRIRWFTPAVRELFPLRSGDVGRHITDLAARFAHPRFVEEVRAVMRDGVQRDAEVRSFEGRWYLKRVRPYHPGPEIAAAGVAITFTDITDLKRLHSFSTAAIEARTVDEAVELALETLMSLHSADMGNVQLYDERRRALRIVAYRGFDPWFLDQFAVVSTDEGSASARALLRRERVAYEDVEIEPVDDRHRETARRAGYRALQSTPLMTAAGIPRGMISTHFRQPRRLTDAECRVADIVANELSSALERIRADEALRESEHTLRRNQGWLAAQKEAFQAAMNGEPFESSLGILARAAIGQMEGGCRCAFYVANAAGNQLRHVVGMTADYARCVDGFEISPESLACGLAVATGEPVITRDVQEEPRWRDWVWLARDHGYRGCWSFPIETATGSLVGSFALYFPEPREPTSRDRELAATFTKTAAIIISRPRETG
jgi:GAF domain-containing protein